MKKYKIVLSLFCFFIFFTLNSNAQEIKNNFNLDFEETSKTNQLPVQWFKWGTDDYSIIIDSSTVFSGKNSVKIFSAEKYSSKSFGCIAYQLPANYSAKEITVKGYIKTENVEEGFAGLLVRIDGNAKMLAYENMQRQNVRGTNDWKQYKITLPFSDKAKKIFVAGLLTGKGKAWFDRFEVLFDDKDIANTPQIIGEPIKAELDNEFDSGSNIEFKDIHERQIENLFKLGKVWGFLKYYHPEIAKGNFNWDYELIRIIPQIVNQHDSKELNSLLCNFVKKLGEFSVNTKTVESENIKLKADIDWIRDENFLGEELSRLLIRVSNADRIEEHYYVSLAPGVENPIFETENPYYNMAFNDDGLKLIGLFRYWNIIQYYFPYRNLIDDNWDSVLKEYIPKIIFADDELSYKLMLLKLIGTIHDTHANIWQRGEILENYWGLNSAPVKVKIVEEKVVVTEVLDKDKVNDLRIGDVILKINNLSAEKLLSSKLEYCPASNLSTKYRDAAKLLLRTNDDSLEVSILREGETFNISLNCIQNDPRLFWQSNIASHKIIDNNIGYIFPGSLAKGEIDNVMQTLKNTNGLIIDLRCYPSDFIVFSLSKYLMPEPIEFVKFSSGSLLKPGEFIFSPPLKVGELKNDYYKNKVVILIDERTQSQAEYTAMALRRAPKALVIGSTTAGADGNLSYLLLPGNVRTGISGVGIYYPDGTETQRVGIIPDIELRPTVEGIRSGRDELLEKAVEMINQN